jgi:hypothetical protein
MKVFDALLICPPWKALFEGLVGMHSIELSYTLSKVHEPLSGLLVFSFFKPLLSAFIFIGICLTQTVHW